MKYAEALTNLHKSGIDRNSTPQEIAAASVGTKLDKNGKPIISNVTQGQNYGSALKNYGLKTYTSTVNSVDAKASPSNKEKKLYVSPKSDNGYLSEALTGKYIRVLENQLKYIERTKGSKYVFENVFGSNKEKYDPDKSEFAPYVFSELKVPECTAGGRKYSEHCGKLDEDMQHYIYDICKKEDVDYYLVLATILHESGCDPDADTTGDASGYMQLTNSTWKLYTDPQYIPPWEKTNALSKAKVESHKFLYGYIKDEYNANISLKNDPHMNIAVGIAAYSDWSASLSDPSMYNVVQHYGEGSKVGFKYMVSSSSEILYYRDVLAIEAGEPDWYIGKYYTKDGKSLVTNYDPRTKQYIKPQR